MNRYRLICLWVSVFVFSFTGSVGAQTLLDATPNHAAAGSSVRLTITGDTGVVLGVDAMVRFSPASGVTFNECAIEASNVIECFAMIPQNTEPGVQDVFVTSSGSTYVGEDLFTIDPCQGCVFPLITRIEPAAGDQGQSLDVTVTGKDTHFASGSSLAFSGSGITVSNVQVSSATRLSARLAIAAGAATGKRDVTVTTGTETATGADLFEVRKLTVPLTITPDRAPQGASLAQVTISGGAGGYTAQTAVSLGSGVTIGSVQSPSDTQLVLADVAVNAQAPIGWRTVTVGSASYPHHFLVQPGPSTQLVSITPNHADRGHPRLAVTLAGQNARFDAAAPAISSSPVGLSGFYFTAAGPDTLNFNLIVSGVMPEGMTDVIYACCLPGDNVDCPNLVLHGAFEVTAPAAVTLVEPAFLNVGAHQTLAVTAPGGGFVQGETEAFIQPENGVTVEQVAVTDSDHLTLTVTVDDTVSGGAHSIVTITGTELAVGKDVLDISNPRITRVVPRGADPGRSVKLTVEGESIPFSAATTVQISGDGLTLGTVEFDANYPNRVRLDVAVAETATPGKRDLSVTAGAVSASASGAFSVYTPETPDTGGGGCGCGGAAGAGGEGMLLSLMAWIAILRFRGSSRPR